MAELFLAKATATDQLFVVKRILPELADQLDFVRMFLDEARIAAQLKHPNVAQVLELGKLNSSIYLVMEYVDGVDLRKILREEMKQRRAIPPRFVAYIGSRLCAGLDYAHSCIGIDGKPIGIVHRDVSPQNIMIGFDGSVKLVDFGIAKAAAMVGRSQPGVIKGKFLYLSPEQLSQDRVDYRADIFSTGTVLYEVSTGWRPFFRTSAEAVIRAVRLEDPRSPDKVAPNYPPELARIVMKCLAKDRNLRYQRAGDVVADLEELLAREGPVETQEFVRYVAELIGGQEAPTGNRDAHQESASERDKAQTDPKQAVAAPPPIGNEQVPTDPRRDRNEHPTNPRRDALATTDPPGAAHSTQRPAARGAGVPDDTGRIDIDDLDDDGDDPDRTPSSPRWMYAGLVLAAAVLLAVGWRLTRPAPTASPEAHRLAPVAASGPTASTLQARINHLAKRLADREQALSRPDPVAQQLLTEARAGAQANSSAEQRAEAVRALESLEAQLERMR